MTAHALSAPLGHLLLDEEAGTLACTVCTMSIEAPPSFGGIPREVMLGSAVVQHAVHRAGRAAGLTTAGKPSAAARAALAAAGMS